MMYEQKVLELEVSSPNFVNADVFRCHNWRALESTDPGPDTHMFPELNYCLQEKNNNTREMIGLGPIGSDQIGMFYVLSLYELCMLVN